MELSHKRLIRQRIVIPFVTDFAVFCSFGVLFPPLAIVIAISMLKDLILWRMVISRFVLTFEDLLLQQNTINNNNSLSQPICMSAVQVLLAKFHHILQRLGLQLKDIAIAYLQSIRMVVLLSAGFWAFAIFDMLGSASSLVVTITMVCLLITSPYWIVALIQLSLFLRRGYLQLKILLFKNSLNQSSRSENMSIGLELGNEEDDEDREGKNKKHQSLPKTIRNWTKNILLEEMIQDEEKQQVSIL
jgi:hypothetical protein